MYEVSTALLPNRQAYNLHSTLPSLMNTVVAATIYSTEYPCFAENHGFDNRMGYLNKKFAIVINEASRRVEPSKPLFQ